VRGAACPRLCQFLRRVGGSPSEQGGPRLKSLSFARNSLGPSEAPLVFSVLPRCLETLSFEGNPLGIAETQAFAEAVKEGRISSVRALNLSETSLNDEKMAILSTAFAAAKPLKVESLLLSSNDFRAEATLSSLLRKETFPFLRDLQLARCHLFPDALFGLAEKLKEGELVSLQSLGLDRVDGIYRDEGSMKATEAFAEGLRAALVPSLRTLSMRGVKFFGEAADAIVSALNSDEAPPLETVDLDVCLAVDQSTPCEETARVLGSGKLRCLRSFWVEIDDLHRVVFIQGVLNAPEPPPWQDLCLFVTPTSEIEEVLKDAFRVDRLSALREFDLAEGDVTKDSMERLFFRGVGESETGLPFLESLNLYVTEAGKGIDFSEGVLRSGKMSNLIELDLGWCMLNDEGMRILGELVRGGHLLKLQKLRLDNNEFREEGMRAFCRGVSDSEQGLPALKILRFGGGRLGTFPTALAAGKLGSLEKLMLGSCRLANNDLRLLAEAFRANDALPLTHLSLYGNVDITEEGLRIFLETLEPQSLPKLEFLDLSATSVHETRRRALLSEAHAGGKLRSIDYTQPIGLNTFIF